MSNNNCGCDEDLESHQINTALINASNQPRDHWRWIFLILQVRQILISRADKTNKASPALDGVSSATPSYSVISTGATEDADSELTGIVEVIPTSSQVSIDVHSDGEEGYKISDVKLQHTNIAKIVKAKDLCSLGKFGGVQGIAEALDTDLVNGIPGDKEDLCSRRMASTLSKTQAPAREFFQILFKSCNNYIIFLLFLSAVLSLGFGIKEEGPRTGWYEGVIIILAIIILVVVASVRDFWRASSWKLSGKQKLSKKREMVVYVVRGGCLQKESISDIVSGDIVCLKKGYQVPADGLLISGEFLILNDGLETINDNQNPFLFYGAKVIEGDGRMLVTSLGANTAWGEMMSQVGHAPSKSPLPAQLDKVSTCTQIIGLLISILILVVLFLHLKFRKESDSELPDLKGKPTASKEFMDAIERIIMKPSGKISILTTSLTIVLVGIVEGLPFVVTLAITYWNKKTLSSKAFAQELLACVTMGSVTTICTDKTGGITLNPLEVDTCWIGEEVVNDDSVIAPDVLEALCYGISTPCLMPESSYSSTEDSLIYWAASKFRMNMEILKLNCSLVKARELSSSEEGGGVLMRKNGDDERNMFLHWKGPATTILAMCSFYYDSTGTKNIMDEQKRMAFEQIIEHMQSKHLKTIAFAYKHIDVPLLEENRLILIGLLGLKHTCKAETARAMEACRDAGVNIILVSEENVSVLKDIALECGMIHNSDLVVLEGENFRNRTDEERMDIIDRIVVMGNSLPSDRHLLVKCLKQKGHTVAVVGVTTNETPSLKEADVGLAMGTWSSDMARESSDIIIWDANFSFLVNILRGGRCTYENIQKYIQLELTMTITGFLTTIITTVFIGHSPITPIQLLWATAVVAVLGGLALLTEPPSEKLMEKQPVSRYESLITKASWRNIVTQALYQVAILVTFQFKGQAILGINEKVSKTLIFNSFVICQLFNQVSARELQKKNVFKGFHQNLWFWVAVVFTVGLQVAFIEIAHTLVGDARLKCAQWAICFLIGIPSWAIDWATKCTSNFIMDWLNGPPNSRKGSTSMTPSAPSASACNLELPLINGNSTAIPP